MPARILVIEDNRDNLELMTYLLEVFGYEVLTAMDGEEGLEVARREFPNLVLSDLQMPKLDGYEVARAFRRDPRLAMLPLVAVTAYAMRGDRDKVLAAGFDGYISKPIVPEEFVGQVERFLEPRWHATAQRALTSDEHGPAQLPHRATILVVDNSPVNLQLMQSTLEPFGYKVITAGSAREALELARENPPDLILSDLHMPDMDGYGFLNALKSHESLKVIPFAIISSTIWGEKDPNHALRMGADKFILRPIEPQRLVAEIEACLAAGKGD